jgi:methionine synthase II (cobalamin-independent)
MTELKMIPDKVHLVGSIGLDTVEEVYRAVGKLLGRRIRRVPDGEPGGRRLWISWQYPLLRANPFLKIDTEASRVKSTLVPSLCLSDGVEPSEIRFSELGYAREARTSYQDFLAARERGELPAGVRFQVCLPTPLAVAYSFCSAKDVVAIEKAYEKAMHREVETVCRAIPHRDLCIQWDLCTEMIIWDGQMPDRYPTVGISNAEIMARIQRLSAAVPGGVELGFHLCYGDLDGKHFVEPRDAGKMVELANALMQTVAHPISYVHMPVPIARTDDAFFQPFRNLKLSPGTELYLGVVHAADGVEGVRKRMAAANKYVSGFGIATECGMARAKTPELVTELLEIHARASQEPSAPRS